MLRMYRRYARAHTRFLRRQYKFLNDQNQRLREENIHLKERDRKFRQMLEARDDELRVLREAVLRDLV